MTALSSARSDLLRELVGAITEAIHSRRQPAPLVLVDAPGGLGKSHMTAQVLAGQRIVWMAQRKEQLVDLHRFLSTPLEGHALPARTPTVEKRPARSDAGFCSHYAGRLKQLEARGFGPYLRIIGCVPCADREQCPYRRWRPHADWIFAPHAWLRLPNYPDIFAGRRAVVIDESPVPELLHAVVADADQIKRWIHLLRSERDPGPRTEARLALLKCCHALLRNPPPGCLEVPVREVAARLGYVFGPWPMRKLPRNWQLIHPPNLMTLRLLGRGARRKDVLALDNMLHALRHDERERPTCVLRFHDDERGPALVCGRVVRPPIPQHLPVIVLDATGLSPLYRMLFGPERAIIRVSARVQQAARIYQITDGRYPAKTLGHPDRRAFMRLMEIIDRYRAAHPEATKAIILKKGLLAHDDIKAEVDARFAEEDVGFFWANRGSNAFQHHDAIFILGAPEMHPSEIEGLARAFVSLYPKHEKGMTLQPGNQLVLDKPHTFEVRQDKDGGLEDRGYGDLADIVYWSCHQLEYEQAILRARPFDPANCKTKAFFLSNVRLMSLDLATELTTVDELLGKEPPLLERIHRLVLQLRAAGRKGRIYQNELAAKLNVTPSAVSKCLSRALEKAREIKRLSRS